MSDYLKKDPTLVSVRDVVAKNVGLTPDEMDQEFLIPSNDMHIENMVEAAHYVKQFLQENPEGPVTIVGDYDVDGISGTVILYETLKNLTQDVRFRIPKRHSEGYGFQASMVDEFNDGGLIICVDNGIVAYEAIEKARRG